MTKSQDVNHSLSHNIYCVVVKVKSTKSKDICNILSSDILNCLPPKMANYHPDKFLVLYFDFLQITEFTDRMF